jgi:hypothetical protein
MATKPQKSTPVLEEITSSEVWLDPLRLPTRLAQRNPLTSASLPQVLHRLQSSNGDKLESQAKNSKRRKSENAVLRHWMDLGDMLLKKQ